MYVGQPYVFLWRLAALYNEYVYPTGKHLYWSRPSAAPPRPEGAVCHDSLVIP
jgi:hypothetical protein